MDSLELKDIAIMLIGDSYKMEVQDHGYDNHIPYYKILYERPDGYLLPKNVSFDPNFIINMARYGFIGFLK